MKINYFVSSCVGPVVDVQIVRPQRVTQEHLFKPSTSEYNSFVFSALSKFDYLKTLPSIYDSIVIQRSHWLHTEGFSMRTFSIGGQQTFRRAFYEELQAFSNIIPFYESLSWALLSLSGCLNPVSTPNIREEILADLEGRSIDESREVLLVFATLFDIYKSYQNSIVVEISAILPGGILRCISLGQTEGFNSYNTVGFINYQPIVYLIRRNVS